MKIKSNRFAILPVQCTECQNYIWFEPYRKGEAWHKFLDGYYRVKICKDCYKRYKFGSDDNVESKRI